LLRKRLNSLAPGLSMFYCASIGFVCFCITEFSAQYALGFGFYDKVDVIRFVRYGLVAGIAMFLLIRFFALTSLIEQRNKADLESKMQALQARIKPHFLFNCLNTISELVYKDAKQAELAIESLALLFRAGLESDNKFHSLDSEINLCKRYVRLEYWRFESRLQVEWDVDIKGADAWRVPKLILQPLIENAIVHGVARDGSINVQIGIRETSRDISMMIENERGEQPSTSVGNGMAVDNIRKRLFVLYDDKQTFRVKESDDSYTVIMRFPKQKTTQREVL